MKLKRVWALALSAAMTVTATASITSTAGAASAASAPAYPSSTLPLITLTVGNGAPGDYSATPDGKEIERLTGVKVQFVAEMNSDLPVLAAANNLPDINVIMSGTLADVTPLVTSGQLLNMDSLLSNYGQTFLNNMPLAMKWSKTVAGSGKGTYIIPNTVSTLDTKNPAPNAFKGWGIRTDIYRAIGSPICNNPAQFLDVLQKMQAYAQDNSSKYSSTKGKKIYAMSGWMDWGLWPFIYPYEESYNYSVGNDNTFINNATGEIQNAFLDTNGIFWEALAWYNKAYQMGILDPNCVIQNASQMGDKIVNGLVLANGYVAAGGWQPNPAIFGDTAIVALLPNAFPYIPAGVYPQSSPFGYQCGNAMAISSYCKNPERAMQFLNYLNTQDGVRVVKNGIYGTDWNVVNGIPQIIGQRLSLLKTGTNVAYDTQQGIGGLFLLGSNGGCIKTTDGYPADLTQSAAFQSDNATPAYKAYAKSYYTNLSYPGQVYDTWLKTGKSKMAGDPPLAVALMGVNSDTTEKAEANANQYVTANISKVVLAKNDDAFNSAKAKIISDLNAMGLAKADAEVNQSYANAQTLAKTFAK